MTWPQYYIGRVSEWWFREMRSRFSRGSARAVWLMRANGVGLGKTSHPVWIYPVWIHYLFNLPGEVARQPWISRNECVTIHQMESDISILSEHAHIGRQLGGIWVAIFGHTLRAAVSASMPRETMSFAIIHRSDGKISRQRASLAFQSISRSACAFSIGFPVIL